MNIDTFKIYCLVVDVGSINQAAKLSFVSQPAVSKQIQQLESTYDTLLFERKNGRLSLTKSGEILYPYAKSIVEEFKRSKESIRESLQGENTTLTVGASFTIGEYLLPSLLGRFKKNNPETKLSLSINNTPRILDELSNEVLDLALVEGVIQNDDFLVESFADDELVLIHPVNHPWSEREEIAIEEITKERMLWRETTSGTRLIIENFLRENNVLDKIENYMELGTTQAIKSAVAAGLGVSIVSRLTVAQELKQGTLSEIKIRNSELKRELWLVKNDYRFHKKIAESFVDFIRH
ncbi:LysR family transcriptional regulator [Virgibacillus profundi]|uniref:LysR family transcriptional regulator n=1 Tax=Virgibacillus profundi TaxID=2024555 RepID=A0A2A2IFI7_9BACI|nr:LysR substrate-binding domain-containing protein [Virgibacillus profundi]PAV30761.1 LysR family transcriptional regulator [Virgibacillus profundi]PXY54944.1 LysR family transcriptional regulator [Virgibacillus profundi]